MLKFIHFSTFNLFKLSAMERPKRVKVSNGATTVEIKTTVTRDNLDSLANTKPQTTLKLLKEIETLRMSDLVLDDDDEPPCSAPVFGRDEKLYNNLVALDVNVECPMKGKTRVRPAVKRDEVPNLEEFSTCSPMSEYSFRHVISEDLPEVSHPVDGHSIYKLKNKWKNG